MDPKDPELTLVEIGNLAKENKKPERRIYKYWQATKEALLYQLYEETASDIRLPTGVEVKTCGHYAHLTCFQAYIDTIDDQSSSLYGTTYMCPMCRRSINGILPLKPDFGFEKLRLHLPFDATKVEILQDIVRICSKRIRENLPTFSKVSLFRMANVILFSPD